VDQKISKIIFA